MPDETRVRLNGIAEAATLCRMLLTEAVAIDAEDLGTAKVKQERQTRKRLLASADQTLAIIHKLSSTDSADSQTKG